MVLIATLLNPTLGTACGAARRNVPASNGMRRGRWMSPATLVPRLRVRGKAQHHG
jgi:hypothetical protein